MVEMCYKLTPYICSICGDNLYFIDKRNKAIDYKMIYESTKGFRGLMDSVTKKDIKRLRCNTCNRYFTIDWSTKFPLQLLDESVLKEFEV